MVNANELRIGNWINLQDSPIKVNGHALWNMEQGLLNGSYSPIILTPEILSKAKFEHYHDNPRLEVFYVNRQWYYPFFINMSRGLTYWYDENLKLGSLHQLQNLFFALTGEELEITLTPSTSYKQQ